ncbi:MAG: C39 family peptidase [Chloroflexota bacterium]
MSNRTRNIIIAIVIFQVLLTIGIFALPRVAQALPGHYYVRLQNHRYTAGVMDLITTPMATALPAPAQGAEQLNIADLPAIPGLDQDSIVRPAALAVPTATATLLPTVVEEVAETDTEAEPTETPSPTPTPAPTATPEPLPDRVVLENLEVVVQGFNNCGPANLSIVLNYFGNATTQAEAASYLKPNREDRNVSPWQIGEYVNDFTELQAITRSGGNLEMLKQFIASGIPVVVEKGYQPSAAQGWYGHYLTVYGYDEEKEEFYSRDTDAGPFDGRARIDSYEEMLHWWQQFNYTFYVVFPPERESRVMSIIPEYLHDNVSMWEFTTELADREIAADPDNVFAWLNRGVSQTRLGEISGEISYYENGARDFDQARTIGLPPRALYYEHRPFMAYLRVGRIDEIMDLTDALLATTGGQWVEEIHWYRGHALSAQGRLSEARESYIKALEVNENFHPAQTSLNWVNSLLSGG